MIRAKSTAIAAVSVLVFSLCILVAGSIAFGAKAAFAAMLDGELAAGNAAASALDAQSFEDGAFVSGLIAAVDDSEAAEKRFYAKLENGNTAFNFYYGVPEGEEDVDWYDASDARWTKPGQSMPGTISSVTFDASVANVPDDLKPDNLSLWFRNMTNLQTIVGLAYLDTSHVTAMEATFENCSSLKSLDLSSFDTSNVERISSMFSGCASLETLNLSGLDLSQVEDMSALFRGCAALKSLDMTGIDTSNATNMYSMFERCWSLATLSLSDFDTSNVTNMSCMFMGCASLEALDLSNFDTSKVTNMAGMFEGMTKLKSLDLSCLNTSNVTDMGDLLLNCQALETVSFGGKFSTSNVRSMDGMFRRCYQLASVDLSSFDTSNATGMGDMFFEDGKLTYLDLSSFDTSNVTEMGGMFRACGSLVGLKLGDGFNTAKVKNMGGMFRECTSLASLDLSGFDTSSATAMGDMFTGCGALATVTFSEAFSFKGDGIADSAKWALLPMPPVGGVYDGKWWKGSGTQFAPEDMQDLTGGDIAGMWLWATGQSQGYTVSYDANGGTGSVASQATDQYGEATIREAGALSRAGYRFVNWNSKPNGQGSPYTPGQVARFTANTTLYAQWDAIFVVESVPSNWGDARITSSIEELAAAIKLTDEEAAMVAGGEKVYVRLTAADITSKLSSDLKKKLVAAPGDGYSLGAALDVNLSIRVGENGDPRLVSNPAKPVSIAFDLPNSLLSDNRTFAASREHEGAVAVAESSLDGSKTMTVKGDGFSTYGIVYKDNPSAATSKPTSSPKTADSAPWTLLLALGFGSLAVLLVSGGLSRLKRR